MSYFFSIHLPVSEAQKSLSYLDFFFLADMPVKTNGSDRPDRNTYVSKLHQIWPSQPSFPMSCLGIPN